jgi:hypothetical protein
VGAVLAVLPPEGVAAEPLSPHPHTCHKKQKRQDQGQEFNLLFHFFSSFFYTYDNTVETVFSTLLEFDGFMPVSISDAALRHAFCLSTALKSQQG